MFRFWKIDFAFLIEIVRRVLCEWKRGIFAFEKNDRKGIVTVPDRKKIHKHPSNSGTYQMDQFRESHINCQDLETNSRNLKHFVYPKTQTTAFL